MKLGKMGMLLLILALSATAFSSDEEMVRQILASGRSSCPKAETIYTSLQDKIIDNLSPRVYGRSYFEVTGVTPKGEHFLIELTAAYLCSTGSRGPRGCDMQYQCHIFPK